MTRRERIENLIILRKYELDELQEKVAELEEELEFLITELNEMEDDEDDNRSM